MVKVLESIVETRHEFTDLSENDVHWRQARKPPAPDTRRPQQNAAGPGNQPVSSRDRGLHLGENFARGIGNGYLTIPRLPQTFRSKGNDGVDQAVVLKKTAVATVD